MRVGLIHGVPAQSSGPPGRDAPPVPDDDMPELAANADTKDAPDPEDPSPPE
jgi:hypothetical protein